MSKQNKNRTISLIAMALITLSSTFLNEPIFASQPEQNKYKAYYELGLAGYSAKKAMGIGSHELFIPLLQSYDQLLFSDLKFVSQVSSKYNTTAEINLHLGYRKLFPDINQMLGIYTSFDTIASEAKNRFNQVTFGLEYWVNRWFIGGNIYRPVGTTTKEIGKTSFTNIHYTKTKIIKTTTTTTYQEKIQPGVDAELGYAITDNLTSYIGGYYFAASGTNPTTGPKIRLTYNYQKSVGRMLGFLDGISIEAGAQRDKPRGFATYLGIKFKIGLTSFAKNSNLTGFERHMIETVRRDPNIIIEKSSTTETNYTTEERYSHTTKESYSQYYRYFYQNNSNNGSKQGTNGTSGSSQQNAGGGSSQQGANSSSQQNAGGGSSQQGANSSSQQNTGGSQQKIGIDDLKNLSQKELLELFGLPENASLQEAQMKWHEYQLKYHPDKNSSNDDNKGLFYNEAYNALRSTFVGKPHADQDYISELRKERKYDTLLIYCNNHMC